MKSTFRIVCQIVNQIGNTEILISDSVLRLSFGTFDGLCTFAHVNYLRILSAMVITM